MIKNGGAVFGYGQLEALLLLWQSLCCVCCVTFLRINFSSTPTSILNLTISSERELDTEFNYIFCIGKYCQFFTHKSNAFLSVMSPIETMHTQMPKNARNHARNSPFPLRHVDFHLTHECLGPAHSPCQTTVQSLYALPHNDTTNSPLVTMGRHKFSPKLPLPLRRSPPKSNTPIPSPTPLTTPNIHADPISRFATAHMCGRTNGTDECSIT